MNTKLDLATIAEKIVYVKPILAADLPDELREKVGDLEMDLLARTVRRSGQKVLLQHVPYILALILECNS